MKNKLTDQETQTLLKEAQRIKSQKKTEVGQVIEGYWFNRALSEKEKITVLVINLTYHLPPQFHQ